MMKLYIWVRKYWIHLIVWLIYISYEISVVTFALGIYGKPLAYFLHYTIAIVLFYVNALYVLPWALQSRLTGVWKLPAIIILEVAVFLLLSFGCDVLLTKWHMIPAAGPLRFTQLYCLKNGYRGLFFIGFSTGYYFLLTYNRERKKSEELEKQRLKEIISRQKAEQELTRAQNAFLKAQINPHFLFNTLDFIYHNVMEQSPVAADAIIMLSEMMRFAIDADKMGEYILLGDELEQVVNLRQLNYLRKNEEIPFVLSYDDDVVEISFIPLVLLTLTENIFKHGDMSKGQRASLKVYMADELLVIESSNAYSRNQVSSTNHTGLINVEKRLRFAYGDAVKFRHGGNGHGRFIVSIKVPVLLLQKNSSPLSISKDTGKALIH